jgi:predicted  nucleic acid-binding Zn-ribbon protein
MKELHQLLAVQDHDTRIDQLNHRRATMPERARLAELQNTRRMIDESITHLSEERSQLAQQQRRLEDEIALVEEKRRSVDAALYGGTVSNPRELQSMQEEISALARRQGQLEDQTIDVMERIEPLESRLAELAKEAETNVADIARATDAVTEGERTIEAELVQELASRDEARTGLPEELIAEYGQLRGRSGGVGVARLVGSQCGACHLTLSAVEVARIKKLPDGAVAHCEECGRILVR